MTDIVERIRTFSEYAACEEAADEIEKLRALCKQQHEALESCYDEECLGLKAEAITAYEEMMK